MQELMVSVKQQEFHQNQIIQQHVQPTLFLPMVNVFVPPDLPKLMDFVFKPINVEPTVMIMVSASAFAILDFIKLQTDLVLQVLHAHHQVSETIKVFVFVMLD